MYISPSPSEEVTCTRGIAPLPSHILATFGIPNRRSSSAMSDFSFILKFPISSMQGVFTRGTDLCRDEQRSCRICERMHSLASSRPDIAHSNYHKHLFGRCRTSLQLGVRSERSVPDGFPVHRYCRCQPFGIRLRGSSFRRGEYSGVGLGMSRVIRES